MVAEYRIETVRAYAAPRVRPWRVTQLWAQTLLVASIVYTFLKYFELTQDNPELLQELGVLTDIYYSDAMAALGGDILNRFFWLAMLAGGLPLLWRYQRRLFALLADNKLLIATMAFCLLTVLWAIDPGIAVRRYAELLIITLVTMAIVVALPSPRQFVNALLVATGIILVLDLLIIPIRPDLAFSWKGEYEGMHGQKNSAGAFLLIAGIIWFFATLRFEGFARRLGGWAVLTVICVLMLMSASKTSQALLPMSLLFAWMLAASSRRGSRWFGLAVAFLVFCIATAILPLGVVSPFVIIDMLYGDVTLTGRTEIWDFVARMINDNMLLGYGYGSFWDLGAASPNIRYGGPLVFAVNQAHNGYLDVAAQIGLIGLGLAVLLLFSAFWRLFPIAQDANADDMDGAGIGIMIALMVAGLIHNVTESSILRSGHPMWVVMLFAIFYLSIVRIRVRYGRRASAAR